MPVEAGTYVVTCAADGRTLLTTRRADGSWTPWTTLAPSNGFYSISCGGYTGSVDDFFNFHVVGAGGRRLHHSRLGPDGNWTAWTVVPAPIDVEPADVCARGWTGFPEGPGPWDYFELCFTDTSGNLMIGVRNPAATWTSFIDEKSPHGQVGFPVNVDRGVYESFESGVALRHLVVKDSIGKIFHAKSLGDTPLPFVDIEVMAGERGVMRDISCAASFSQLHVCATSSGQLWHSLRVADSPWLPYIGSWTQFGDVEGQAGEQGNLERVACRIGVEGLHVCVLTAEGRLWHTIRRPDGSWAPLADLSGMAGPGVRLLDVALVTR